MSITAEQLLEPNLPPIVRQQRVDAYCEREDEPVIEGAEIYGPDLSGLDLHALHLRNCTIHTYGSMMLRFGPLTGCTLDGCSFGDVTFKQMTDCSLRDVYLERCCIGRPVVNSNFRGGTIRHTRFIDRPLPHMIGLQRCDFRDVRFECIDATAAAFEECDLRACVIDRSRLSRAEFRGARLEGAALRRVNACDATLTREQIAATRAEGCVVDDSVERVTVPDGWTRCDLQDRVDQLAADADALRPGHPVKFAATLTSNWHARGEQLAVMWNGELLRVQAFDPVSVAHIRLYQAEPTLRPETIRSLAADYLGWDAPSRFITCGPLRRSDSDGHDAPGERYHRGLQDWRRWVERLTKPLDAQSNSR
jgi:uncharacterized protein YjbI with pentapeptide repeats